MALDSFGFTVSRRMKRVFPAKLLAVTV